MCVAQRSLTKKQKTSINGAKEMRTEYENLYHASLIVHCASPKQNIKKNMTDTEY